MANAAVIGIVVLLMVCCLSSSAAAGSYFGGVIPGTLPELAKLISKSVEDGKCPDDEDQKKRIMEAKKSDFEDAIDPLGQFKDIIESELAKAQGLCSPAPAPEPEPEPEPEPTPADTTGNTGEDDEPPLTSGTDGTIAQAPPLQGTIHTPTVSSTPAPRAPAPVAPAAFSVALGKKGAICSGTHLHKTNAWALADRSVGVKEFDTPEYANWVEEAQKQCVSKDNNCKFVSVWKDAGWRGYGANECSDVVPIGNAATFGAGSNRLVSMTGIPFKGE